MEDGNSRQHVVLYSWMVLVNTPDKYYVTGRNATTGEVVRSSELVDIDVMRMRVRSASGVDYVLWEEPGRDILAMAECGQLVLEQPAEDFVFITGLIWDLHLKSKALANPLIEMTMGLLKKKMHKQADAHKAK